MESRQVTGVVLIVGVLTMLAGIALHPHHGPAGSGTDVAWRNLVVAAIVVGSYGLLGVGFLRLLRSMTPRLWSDVAGVALAFSGVCGALAAVAGHVVVPRLLEQLELAQVDAIDVAQAQVHQIVMNNMIFSFTLAQTSFVAWAIAVLFLSIALVHGRTVWKVVGASGIVLGLFILTVLTLGRLDMSLHNVGLVALVSGIWVAAIGVTLCRNQSFSSIESN